MVVDTVHLKFLRRLPSPPMVIASETPIVLYCHASIPCFWIESLTILPRSSTNVGTQIRDLSKTVSACLELDESQTYNAYWASVSYGKIFEHVDRSLARIALPPH